MSDQPLANEAEARTETGEIKPVQSTTPAEPTPSQPTQAPAPAKTEGESSLLNKDEKPAETKAEEKAGAPEKYADFKAPEGITLDAKAIEAATPLFKEAGLTQDQAQKFVDFYAAKQVESAQAPYDMYAQMREGWQKEVKADPEIGGKLPQVKETVSRALDTLGDATLAKNFREAMDLTGAGDHPAFVKTIYKLAQMVTEGRHVAGSGPSALGQRAPGAAPPSIAQAIYPKLP